MDEPRFYRKSWGVILIWTLVSGIIYFWWGDGLAFILANLWAVVGEALIFALGMLIWLAFFAQFILPVRTFRDRQKIFDRLRSHVAGRHGPAIFIRDGIPVVRQGEKKKTGPGVLWLDSASGAVTRTTTKFRSTIGPGVHFTENGEYLAGTVDLHTQFQKLGPREQENVFSSVPKEDAEISEKEKHKEIQKRRFEVRAWTRDGIEVVPNVTVVFKIDAKPTKTDGEPGSRFGYDTEAVRKAVTGEGINPGKPSEVSRRRVAWNQLPALLAVDLWREYMAKFTLQELFEAGQTLPLEPSALSRSAPVETQVQASSVTTGGNALSGILHELNARLARWADRCESVGRESIKVKQENPHLPDYASPRGEVEKVTALQVINHMLKARLTQTEVPTLDDSGRPSSGTLPSPEYQLLEERGLKLISASVSGLRFAPSVEEQLIRQWSANWLDNAKAERKRIERKRSFLELNAGVEAFGDYAESLSRNLLRVNPRKDPKDTLKTLLLRTRDELVKDDQLHHRANLEREELEEIIQWVERNGQ